MARRSAAPTYQYEPLITPSEWSGEERNFSIRLTQILDNLHAKIGALTGKAPVREITAADLSSKSTADRAALYANGARLLKVTNDDTIVVLSLAADGSTQFMSSNKPLTNLLDNSDFTNPINQRDITSITATSYIYTIDRWKLDEGNTITVNAGSITIDGGWLTQLFENVKIDISKTYTAALCLGDGTIVCETGVFGNHTRRTYWGFDASETSTAIYIYIGILTGVTAKWAALYEGSYTADILPPYVPKGYAAELAECQRHYVRFLADYTLLYGTSGAYNGSNIRLTLPVPVKMRIVPTAEAFTANFLTSSGAKTDITFTPDSLTVNNSTISFDGSASSAISASPTYTNVLAELKYRDLELHADL